VLPTPPMRQRPAVVLLSIVVGTWAATALAQPEPSGPPEAGAGSNGGSAAGSGAAPGTGSDAGSGSAGSGDTTSGTVVSPDTWKSIPIPHYDTSTIAPAECAPCPAPAPPAPTDAGFLFGSYGRILAGSDLRGGKPEAVAVVAHGPRIVEKSYLELDLQYRFIAPSGRRVRTVTTLAFGDSIFHDTGEFDAKPALRNFFAEVDVSDRLSAWVGSRMYRGDDIYLFDYWPLDDQNTVGAGARYQLGANPAAPYVVSAHVGWNRLLDEFQFQQIEVPDPAQGATTVTQLNRQRTVASATVEAPILAPGPSGLNLRAKVHAELQTLPSGTRRRDDGTFEALPTDKGFTVGVELAAFGLAPSEQHYNRHANVFARYSKGLAAFDELAPPTSFDTQLRTYPRASELVFGLSGTWDHALGNVMFGALSRRFIDADRNTQDVDDGWEYALDVRPLAHAWKDLYAGADLSYQVRFPRGLNPTSQRASDPAIVQIAPMVVWSPMGPSAYARPELRLVYRAARLNDGARDLYAPDDLRHDRPWVHFLGVQAEWWFNSASYR